MRGVVTRRGDGISVEGGVADGYPEHVASGQFAARL